MENKTLIKDRRKIVSLYIGNSVIFLLFLITYSLLIGYLISENIDAILSLELDKIANIIPSILSPVVMFALITQLGEQQTFNKDLLLEKNKSDQEKIRLATPSLDIKEAKYRELEVIKREKFNIKKNKLIKIEIKNNFSELTNLKIWITTKDNENKIFLNCNKTKLRDDDTVTALLKTDSFPYNQFQLSISYLDTLRNEKNTSYKATINNKKNRTIIKSNYKSTFWEIEVSPVEH